MVFGLAGLSPLFRAGMGRAGGWAAADARPADGAGGSERIAVGGEIVEFGDSATGRLAAAQHGGVARADVNAAFKAACRTHGSARALEDDSGGETYAELALRVSRIARVLSDLGLAPGDRCALLAHRGRDVIALILAVLHCGATYVPIDPTYPDRRIAEVITDSAPRLVVSDGAGAGPFASVSLREILAAAGRAAPLEAAQVEGETPAYVMYTSGSTGQSKGVIVPHRAITSLVLGQAFLRLAPGVKFLQLAPLAFDASTLEIYGPLLNGGSLAILTDERPSLDGIGAFLQRWNVTSAWFTSGLFNALVEHDPGMFRGLDEVVTGGDVVSPGHVARALAACPRLTVVNGYGPTESTTFTCCYRIPRDWPGFTTGEALPIGPPIRNREIAILDPDMKPVMDGAAGELVCRGAGVALGYLDRPDLTARAFIDDPIAPGRRAYRTGDVVRRRPDGVVEFVGRIDRQIKVSGHRVELDDVERTILGLPGVKHAAVVAVGPPGALRIAAFVVPADAGNPSRSVLLAAIRTELPDHATPSILEFRPDLPLGPTGKVDRKALAETLSRRSADPHPVGDAGSEALATTVARVLAGVLGRDIDPDQPFFDQGFRSLDLVRAHSILRQTIRQPVSLVDLFTHPTVHALAAFLGSGDHRGPSAGEVAQRQSSRNAALARVRAARGTTVAGRGEP